MKVAVFLQQMQSYREREIKGISPFWLLIHLLCCTVSTVLGFRFSRLLFFLFFSTSPLLSPHHLSTITTTTTTTTITTITTTISSLTAANSTASSLPHSNNHNTTTTPTLTAFSQPVTTHPVVGRHGIRVRPWPHPDPVEMMRAHQIIRQVQLEQRKMFSPTKTPRPVVVVTPTYSRAAQALHLTALAQTLRLVPYRVAWVVVEAGGVTDGTASILARSRVPFVHVGFDESMPDSMEARRFVEAKMRVHALR